MRNIAKMDCMIVTLLLTVFQQRAVFIVSADWDSHRSRWSFLKFILFLVFFAYFLYYKTLLIRKKRKIYFKNRTEKNFNFDFKGEATAADPCWDVNECTELGRDPCEGIGSCTNTIGSYACFDQDKIDSLNKVGPFITVFSFWTLYIT